MSDWIALFRGINVGGKNVLPMKELVAILERLGLEDVRTYIQSGNASFGSAVADRGELASQIARGVEAEFGFEPGVILLTADELATAIDANPFPEAAADPKRLHLYFLEREPDQPDLELLESAVAGGERFRLTGTVFYLHAPAGIGRSKLAAKVEKALGVPATARNWRTAARLLEIARDR